MQSPRPGWKRRYPAAAISPYGAFLADTVTIALVGLLAILVAILVGAYAWARRIRDDSHEAMGVFHHGLELPPPQQYRPHSAAIVAAQDSALARRNEMNIAIIRLTAGMVVVITIAVLLLLGIIEGDAGLPIISGAGVYAASQGASLASSAWNDEKPQR